MVSIAGDSKASADAPLSGEGEGVEFGKGEFKGPFHQSTVVDVSRFVWGVVSVVDDVVFV